MPKANFLFFLNAYNDLHQTSTPALNNFKWSREINGVPYSLENSQQIQVAASTTSQNLIPYPFSSVKASGNANIVSANSVANLAGSTPGIAIGQLVAGNGIAPGTTIVSISGLAVTMSAPASSTELSALSFYNPASFIYMESDQAVSVIYNNGSAMALNPFQINGITAPGVFFINGPVYSLTVTNAGSATANVFLASMG